MSELARAGVRSAPVFVGAAAQPSASKLAHYRWFRHKLCLTLSSPTTALTCRSFRYPPTQSRPHKKVRTRSAGTVRHGLIKNAFFEAAVPSSCTRH
ncbi:hypothetical protein C9383_12180 [Pseudomonas palleroniana]|uniref:Uncharacterized protein n=1 Tax=Pseudomonas palleroniana TaxID=191390 RepID=A0A2T4FXH1_9PSED|nr:hypothetical protein F7R03_05975 [Pseudomonas palleroniana]PTC28119.1 hypothetical protein C9383_12180 [Pseudomonas palleroniana]